MGILGRMLALVISLGLICSSAATVSIGGECWSSANGVAAGGCSSGTQCGPWLPTGGTWDGSSPWYCLAYPKLTSGATCDYATKNGLCDTGLTCCNGACASSSTTCTETTTTTAAPTTTTTGAAATAGTNAAGQVTLGGECWSSANGVASGDCAPGAQCGPWIPNGGTWDGTSAWYCLSIPKLASGAACDYDVKMGLCDTGLSCCNRVCASTCDNSTTTTTERTTSFGETTSTTTSTTSTTTTTTTTTTVACLLGGQEICGDSTHPEIYAEQCCTSPYTCEPVTGSTRTSMCNGVNLPEGSSCWESSASNGTCGSGLKCRSNYNEGATTGTCATFTASSTCVDTGVSPFNLCWYSETQTYVKGGSCCDDFNTGLRSFCIAQEDNPTGDKYCMPYGLSSGSVCGMTAASNFAGICDASLGCVNGTCGTTTTTTTTTSTTTTSTTTTST